MSVRSAVIAAVVVAGIGFGLGRLGDDAARVTVTRTVATVASPTPHHLDRAWIPTAVIGGARPNVSLDGAWMLARDPGVLAVAWRGYGDAGKFNTADSTLEIWTKRREAWTKLFERRRPGWIRFEIEQGDVTRDDVLDLLVVEANSGSGYCGDRSLLSVQDGRVHELFRRDYCERRPAIADGLLVVAEPIGDCPHVPGNVHCYGGHRMHILEWDGTKRVVDETYIRCKTGLRADRLCRRAA